MELSERHARIRSNPLLGYRLSDGKEYRIVMVQPFMPESALPKPPPKLECDICGKRAVWFDDFSMYCRRHRPVAEPA